jgi:hypothetical protein
MAYLENKLNEFDSYSYNISLHMVRPELLFRGKDALGPEQSVEIINNVKFSNYNISRVTQHFVVGPGLVRASFGNKFTLVIQEQSGCTLLDTIKRKSSALGIISHIQAKYILVVEFIGRMPSGRGKKFDQTFYYPVSIVQFEFKVTDGGTTYTVDAIENSTTAYSYLANVIKDQITIVAETVGEFVSKFQDAANTAALRVWELNPTALYVDDFEFIFDEETETDDWAKWRFQQLDEDNTGGGFNIIGPVGGPNALQVTINNGSNITDLFGMVLQLTKEYKEIVRSDDASRSKMSPSDNTGDKLLDAFPVFHKIIADVKYKQYDILRGEYAKTIVYKLKKFINTDEIVDPIAYMKSITNEAVQKKRVRAMREGNLLGKRYDYIFTGKNTEVIDLDLTFNYAYYYTVPHGGGLLGDADIFTPNRVKDFQNALENIKKKKTKLKEDARMRQPDGQTSNAEALRNLIPSYTADVDRDIALLKTEYGLTDVDIAHQIRFATDVIPDDDTATSDNDRKSGAFKFGALKANIENTSDLIKIELAIRGDPYWMGMPTSFVKPTRNTADLADYELGTQNFFLHVMLPAQDPMNKNSSRPNADYQISGVYSVISVINEFNNGLFTQYLSAVRDLGTNTKTAIAALDK